MVAARQTGIRVGVFHGAEACRHELTTVGSVETGRSDLTLARYSCATGESVSIASFLRQVKVLGVLSVLTSNIITMTLPAMKLFGAPPSFGPVS